MIPTTVKVPPSLWPQLQHLLNTYGINSNRYTTFDERIKKKVTGVLSQFAPDTGRDYPNMSWKDLTEGRYIVAGSPETVRQQLEELIKTLRVGNVFCLLHLGNMPDDKVRHSTKLFAEKVMPHLRNLWPEWNNHDDRFWCHPMHEPVPTRIAAE